MKNKSFSKIALYIIVFVLTIIALDRLYGLVSVHLESKVTEKTPNSMLMEHTMWNVETDVVIIGSSEANHSYVCQIIQDSLGMSVYNCGRDGSGFLYQNCMIDGLLQRYSPKLIIWAIYPTFLNDPDDLDIDRLSRVNPFYDTNIKCRNAINSKSRFESLKMLSWSYRYNSRLLTYLYKSVSPDYDFDRGYAPLYKQKKGLEICNAVYEGTINEHFLSLFKETLEICNERGVKIALVITPRFERGDYISYPPYKEIVNTALCYPNTILIDDYYQDSHLMQAEFYADNNHLLDKGAREFTSLLSKKLKGE